MDVLGGAIKDLDTAGQNLEAAAAQDLTAQIIPSLKQALADFGNENKVVLTITCTLTLEKK
jgi:hypothetical protein